MTNTNKITKGTVFPTHTDITLDVDIPNSWTNVSYHNDVCPSFSRLGLQIFLCDEATRKAEGFGEKYTIILEEKYGEAEDPLLATNDWNEVLNFVKKHELQEYENTKIALKKALNKKKPLTKGEIVKQVRKAKKELSICFDTNLIDARDRAINNCFFILDKIIKESI